MAGTSQNFNRGRFEDAIRFAMRMGAPTRPEDRATFHFKPKRIYPAGTKLDQTGKPLNSSIRAEYVRPAPLVLEEVAIEHERANPQELPVGVKIPTRVVLTILDAEYQLIKERAANIVVDDSDPQNPVLEPTGEEFAFEVELGGDRYRIGYRMTPLALFDAGVHQVVCYAMDES